MVFFALILLAGCGGRSFVASAPSLAPALSGQGTRSAQSVQAGDGQQLQSLAIPSGTAGLVNGTDEAIYALSSDGTAIYRVPMIHGSQSTFPLGAAAYPYSLIRGPYTLNTFWFTQRRGASQSDAVAFLQANGTVTRYASPVTYPTSIAMYSDNQHMYVTGESCLCTTSSVMIGVLNLDGTGEAAYELPVPANTSASVYDGLTVGPDKRLWFPVRLTSASGSTNAIARFDPVAKTFKTFPLTDTQAITGIATLNGALVFARPDALVEMTTSGVVTVLPLPSGVSGASYPSVGPDGNLWAGALDYYGSLGAVVQFSLPSLTPTLYDFSQYGAPGSQARGAGYVHAGPDDNMWFGATDSNLYIIQLHTFSVQPSSITVTAGKQEALSVSESSAAGTMRVTSSNTSIATVTAGSGSYLITGVSPGACTVTVTDQKENVVSVPVTVDRTNAITIGGQLRLIGLLNGYYGYVYAGPGIALGSDGAMWFPMNGQMGRLSPSDTIPETFDLPNTEAEYVARGSDGAIWFTEAPGKIGRIATGGSVSEFALSNATAQPYHITSGPDGALWFGEVNAHAIGRITTTGVARSFPIPSTGDGGMIAGPDGAVWFTEPDTNKIGRITTHGVVTEYPIPVASGSPTDITVGPDGALWFTSYPRSIGRIALDGKITMHALPPPSPEHILDDGSFVGVPVGIALGGDGGLWFTETPGPGYGYAYAFGRIDPVTGVVAEYEQQGGYPLNPPPTPGDIATGADGLLYFVGLPGVLGQIQ